MVSVDDNEDIIEDTGVHIGYIDDDGDTEWYSDKDRNVECNFKIDADLSEVKPLVEELTVTSYDIYNKGNKEDLLDFINRKMSTITLGYADGSVTPAVFKWTETDSNISSVTWNAKGGDYTVTQKYNDNYDITVTVHVVPIKLIDFEVENSNITYWTGAGDYPSTFDDLKLAKKAKPILDTYIPNGGIPEREIEWYRLENESSGITTIPQGIADKQAGTYTFIGYLSIQDGNLTDDFPWLTVDNTPEIKMIRNVVDSEDDIPKALEVISASTDDNGVLSIKVKNADNSLIPNNTEFIVRMPGGEIIDTSISGYNVTINDDGTATISISADASIETEKKLAQVINLGNRAGQFEIASKEPDKTQGPYTGFSPEPRKNKYLNSCQFDYSGSLSAMFPVKAGVSLPTTVTLPRPEDFVGTTYNGYDGTETGKLSTFTVDSWDVVSGDISLAGSVVTVRGMLSTTSYTNYGRVSNDDSYTVEIKYLVVDGENKDKIDTIPDFVYDKQQVGYDYDKLQTNMFTVSNTGATDIYGLSATISLSTSDATLNKEAFVITKELPQILEKGSSVDFGITTKYGLDIGNYICTVSIMSNDNVLQTFQISFEVTKEPTYKIDVSVNDENLGSAKTESETYTSESGETIKIIAKPKEDCIFTGWTCEEGDVTFDNASNVETTFIMPSSDVKIKANFKESLGAKLRATELMVKDADNKNQDLRNENWQTVQFDPVNREYYVVVPNNTEKVKLWFKLREEAKNAELTLTHDHNSTQDTLSLTSPTAEDTSDDSYYKSDEAILDVSPVDNLLTLTMKYNDPSDDPDEGEVTRSYKIHVYRKIKESELMVFNYGNSPYGLIMRDDSILTDDKQTAKDEFINNNYTFTQGYTPVGATVGTTYNNKAWANANYDLDDSALFVINNDTFKDSGFTSVVNSIGEEVTDVTKKITVNVLEETDSSKKDGSSDDYVYVSERIINLPSDGIITELQSERIRPDHYDLVYSFTDFDGSVVSVKKPLILLNTLGDINNDKIADTTDVSRIKNRFSKDIADNNNTPDYNDGGLLFRYRVCDVNKDGVVNAIDANYIRANKLNQFYANGILKGGGA